MRALAMAALLAALLAAPRAAGRSGDDDDADDADSDPAAYLVIITHENGQQCSASLISRVTAVTTAACARAGAGEQLWALAARLLAAAAAPPALLAAGTRRVARAALAGAGRDPADPALDLAVLELEAPFGAGAAARAIVTAAPAGGCEAARECYTLRARAVAGARRVRFRVGSAARAPAARCAARLPHWAAAQHRLLCYTGDELCERDLGGGVVCGGHLCGVLSAVAGAEAAGEALAGRCGNTFAGQDIARWRRFLHCAHSLGLCGRSSCKTICSERRFLDDADLIATSVMSGLNVSSDNSLPDVHRPAPPRAATRAHATLGEAEEFSARSTFRSTVEFEPNRADFKVTPCRTSHAGLKGGEYGDNAADYSGEEPANPAGPPERTARPPAPAARTLARAAPAAPAASLATPPAPALRAGTAPVPSLRASSSFSVPFMLVSNYVCISFMNVIVYFMY